MHGISLRSNVKRPPEGVVPVAHCSTKPLGRAHRARALSGVESERCGSARVSGGWSIEAAPAAHGRWQDAAHHLQGKEVQRAAAAVRVGDGALRRRARVACVR